MADSFDFTVDILVPGKEPGQDDVSALFLDRSNVWRAYKGPIEANAFGFRVTVVDTIRFHVGDTLSLRLEPGLAEWEAVMVQIPLRNMLSAVHAKKTGASAAEQMDELLDHVRIIRAELERLPSRIWQEQERTVTATPIDESVHRLRQVAGILLDNLRSLQKHVYQDQTAAIVEEVAQMVAQLPTHVWQHDTRGLTDESVLSALGDVRDAVGDVPAEVWAQSHRELTGGPTWGKIDDILSNVKATPKDSLSASDVPLLIAQIAERVLALDVRNVQNVASGTSIAAAVLSELGHVQDGKILRDNGTVMSLVPEKKQKTVRY